MVEDNFLELASMQLWKFRLQVISSLLFSDNPYSSRIRNETEVRFVVGDLLIQKDKIMCESLFCMYTEYKIKNVGVEAHIEVLIWT